MYAFNYQTKRRNKYFNLSFFNYGHLDYQQLLYLPKQNALMRHHLTYTKINKYIYIGTTICCKKHFNQLLKMGVVADIDLEKEKMDRPSGVTAFLWLPVQDFQAPSHTQLHLGAHFIDDLVRHKQKCYVHCNEGNGRAPTMVAAYFILKDHSVESAVNKIKRFRKSANPNERQIKALEEFAKKV